MNLSTLRNPPANLTRQQRKNWRGARHSCGLRVVRFTERPAFVVYCDIREIQAGIERASVALEKFWPAIKSLSQLRRFDAAEDVFDRVMQCAPKP